MKRTTLVIACCLLTAPAQAAAKASAILAWFDRYRTGKPTVHRVEHFGAIGRGPVRVKSLKVMLNMLEQALAEE